MLCAPHTLKNGGTLFALGGMWMLAESRGVVWVVVGPMGVAAVFPLRRRVSTQTWADLGPRVSRYEVWDDDEDWEIR